MRDAGSRDMRSRIAERKLARERYANGVCVEAWYT
jgi:hypothetical protein